MMHKHMPQSSSHLRENPPGATSDPEAQNTAGQFDALANDALRLPQGPKRQHALQQALHAAILLQHEADGTLPERTAILRKTADDLTALRRSLQG